MLTSAQARHRLTAATARVSAATDSIRDRIKIVQDAKRAVKRSRQLESDLAAARDLIVSVCAEQQDIVRSRLDRTVSAALAVVFGNQIRFRLRVAAQRNTVTMHPEVGYFRHTKSGKTGYRWMPIDSVGGGVVDIVAFASRVAVTMMMMRPTVRPVLFFDEPFKHVADVHLDAVAEMLRRVAQTTGIQFIIVTHEETIIAAASRTIRVTKNVRSHFTATQAEGEPA